MNKLRLLFPFLATLIVLITAAPLAAQISSPFGKGKKGEIYGLDVKDPSRIVFVVDLSMPAEVPQGPSLSGQVGEAVRDEAIQRGQRELIKEAGEMGAMAAGPAGMLVRGALAKKRDKVEQARGQVVRAIEGLEEDQSFGIVYFENAPLLWQPELVPATEDLRKQGANFVKTVQGGVTGLQGAMMGAAGMTPEMQRQTAGAGGVIDLKRALEMAFELDPEMIVVVTGTTPPASLDPAAAGATPAASSGMAGAPPGAVAPASGAPTAADAAAMSAAIEQARQAGIAVPPGAGVPTYGGAPPSREAILARVAELNADRDVVIHTALVGDKKEHPFLRELAESNGGEYLTDE